MYPLPYLELGVSLDSAVVPKPVTVTTLPTAWNTDSLVTCITIVHKNIICCKLFWKDSIKLNIYYLADSGLRQGGRWELLDLQHEQTYFNTCDTSKA
jgi:hypothetical protein